MTNKLPLEIWLEGQEDRKYCKICGNLLTPIVHATAYDNQTGQQKIYLRKDCIKLQKFLFFMIDRGCGAWLTEKQWCTNFIQQ